MENLTEKLSGFLEKYSHLRPFFKKIGDLYEKRRGVMPKTLTLAKEVNFADFAVLQSIFGQFLSRNSSGTVKLNYEKIAGNLPKGADFMQAVFEALGRNVPEFSKASDGSEFLLQLQLRYPQWAEVLADLFSGGTAKKLLFSAGELVENALKTTTFCFAESEERETCLRFSNLGAKLFNDSKILRPGTPLYNLTADLLIKIFDDESLNRKEAFLRVGVVENLTAIKMMVYGPLQYESLGRVFDWPRSLWLHEEAVVLNMQQLSKIGKIQLTEVPSAVITCENETPFNDLMKEFPRAVIIYTEGYPNSAVKNFLQKLDYSGQILHWGDSDPEGLEIAAQINAIKPVKLWRCELTDLLSHKESLIKFTEKKRDKAEKLLKSTTFLFREELEFGLENGWLEQESFDVFVPKT